MKLKSLLILTFTFITSISVAQDLHLTQYLTSNLSLNPAYTGYYEGDYQFTLNHRNQWRQLPSPMVTNKLSAEKRIKHFNKEFGIGFMVADDRVSSLNLSTNKFLLSGAYQVNRNNNLWRVGVQSGIVLRQTDFGEQTFPTQWNYDLGVFDQDFATNETTIEEQDLYLDVNAGLSWTKRFNKLKLNAGFALFHINRPKNGFANGTELLRLPMRKVANVRADYNLTNKIILTPNILYMFTTNTKDLNFGILGRYQINNDFNVGLGLSYRGEIVSSDAMIPTLLLGYKRFDFGFSNDYHISGLNDQAAAKRSYELSIIYRTPSATPRRVTIPCERI